MSFGIEKTPASFINMGKTQQHKPSATRMEYSENTKTVAGTNVNTTTRADLDNISLYAGMGISLSGKVDGTKNIEDAKKIVEIGEFKNADKAKVVRYIKNANTEQVDNAVAYVGGEMLSLGAQGHIEDSGKNGLFADVFGTEKEVQIA